MSSLLNNEIESKWLQNSTLNTLPEGGLLSEQETFWLLSSLLSFKKNIITEYKNEQMRYSGTQFLSAAN
jgi:hypothetical protein